MSAGAIIRLRSRSILRCSRGEILAQSAEDTVQQSTQVAPAETEEFVHRSSVPPERMAWLVMLFAFAMFCLLTLTTAVAIYSFLFRSTAAIPVVLQVSKGTVGITGSDFVEAVERQSEDLTNTQISISTDSLSQATIQFSDILADEEVTAPLLAAVTLQNNTFVTFDRASRPRFDWSLAQQTIRLSRLKGELDILVTLSRNQPFLLSVMTAQGMTLQLTGAGRYRISASDDEVRLLNITGEAAAYFTDDMSSWTDVPDDRELIVRLGNRSFDVRTGAVNVLSNSSFSLQDRGDRALRSGELPESWNCLADQEGAPVGKYSLEEFDGRLGARLRRLDNATSHGEVSCRYSFGDEGLNVREYDSVEVLVTFYLKDQSLSQCGTQGSECPLMLRIDYDDSVPVPRSWIHGFHYEKEVVTDFDKRCLSCIQEHQIINKRVWYTYESENLLTLIDKVDHPARLNSLEFYASGHQFDTVVSEIILLLGKSVASAGVADDQS